MSVNFAALAALFKNATQGLPTGILYGLFIALAPACRADIGDKPGAARPLDAAEAPLISPERLADLSLEDLLAIEITSASKKSQRLADTASAAFVISQDDIRRSGATSIPEILRMAPGLEVARIGNNKWAVTSRGFNGRFANKLLVLIDGRSVYNSLFSGVWWEEQDTVLEDIERIEIIRGPGAALWGSNAVNGVINIITKNARDTQGSMVAAVVGDQERANLSARYGGQTEQGGYFRVFAKASDRGPAELLSGQNALDGWRQQRVGFRLDQRVDTDRFSFQGDAYNSRAGDSPVSAPHFHLQQQGTGADLGGRWERQISETSSIAFQAYFDHTRYYYFDFQEVRDTLDLDFQHQLALGNGQEMVWGLSYRYSRNDITSIPHFFIQPAALNSGLLSAFMQDDITLVPDRWRLTLGTKLEHNIYTGIEVQPNVRLLWTPDNTTSWWGAVSRAVRIPSRFEYDSLSFRTDSDNHTTMATGNRNFGPETLLAWELGYRKQITPRLSLDVATFFNQYSGLRDYQAQPIVIPGVVPYALAGVGHADVGGLEIAIDWRPAPDWRLQSAYTWQHMAHITPTVAPGGPYPDPAGTSPRNQLSIRSSHSLSSAVKLDFWLRHVGDLPAINIPAYTELDARLGWSLSRDLEFSLVGQNLLHASHAEYTSDLISTAPTRIPRGLYARLQWKF